MRHLHHDRGREADVCGRGDGEEVVEPGFGGVQAGVEGVEPCGGRAVGELRGAREGELVDGEGGVVEVEEEGFYFGRVSVLS
jgi:hypothetical protein